MKGFCIFTIEDMVDMYLVVDDWRMWKKYDLICIGKNCNRGIVVRVYSRTLPGILLRFLGIRWKKENMLKVKYKR